MQHHGSTRRVFRDLPGEASVDQALVSTASQRLQDWKRAGELENALEVGRYLLATFFARDGDVVSEEELIQACRGGRPHATWRALLRSGKAGWSAATLYRFVRVARQYPLLGDDVRDQLSLTHHRALLGVPDLSSRRTLARRAVREAWTSRRLEAEVKAWRARFVELPIGRPPLTSAQKTLRTLERAFGALEDLEPGDLSRDEREALSAALRDAADRALSWAQRCEGGGRINAMISLAYSARSVSARKRSMHRPRASAT